MRNRFWCTLSILLVTLQAVAQLYNFKEYSVNEGMPEFRINAVCEDRRGNLWIGTQGGGLLRFDGYSFYTYLKEDGLLNNFVNAIYEDDKEKLWIGTDEGVCIYDGIRFSHFNPLPKQPVKVILQDAALTFWFGTRSNGLYKFDGKSLTQFTTSNGLIGNTVNCLYLDNDANLWIGTTQGVGQYGKRISKSYTQMDGLPSNNINGITEDKSGNLWFATDNGVSQFNGNSFSNFFRKNGIASNEVHSLLSDERGNIWFGTSGGITKYSGSTFESNDANAGQRDQVITCVFQDSEGNLWFGSSDGKLSKLDSERFIHYPENDQLGKRVYSIIQAINGNIICGTSLGGTTIFDGKQYTLLDGIEGLTSSIVQSFYYAPDSTLWLGTMDEGVYKFSKSRFFKYTVEEGLVSNNITGFAVDVIGNMWVASADSGVSVMNIANDSLIAIKNYKTEDGLASNRISAIASDRLGTIWIGLEDAGINRITIQQDPLIESSITHFGADNGLNSNVIHDILLDSMGVVYIGTSQGISIYDGKRFFGISKSDGLGSNNIYSLILDNNRDLWAGTERGVNRISIDKNFMPVVIRHYDADEGFKGGEVYRNSSCKDREGNIWFGTVNGLVKYNQREEVDIEITPKVHITGIKLFFDKIENTRYADSVSAWYPIPFFELTLPYNQNNLSFSFIGIHHRNPQAVRYKWILEGFSNDWSPALEEQEAVFSNLPPGEYTFKVMACNEYAVWNDMPAVYAFSILPPLWERWWARVGGMVVIVLIIWIIFHQRLRRIHAKNKIIQEKLEMEKNILVLEHEAARLQMNPHFIFNSLNSIQGFIATNDPFQAKRYLAKFARLMRLILENAREEFIPLKNELDILENYLELEKLSSNNKFNYTITLDEALDPEAVEIPPMMIQPFVENAIIHGVKKKEGVGSITIHFSSDDKQVTCEIIDNGIGRKKSESANAQSRPNHKSTGISVTTRRLEQYSIQRNVNAGITIEDLEEGGEPRGTKVIISIPFEAY